jgi:hypothetical protein
MASTISAGTTSGTAIAIAGDTTGNLAFTTQAGANTITVPNSTGTLLTTGSPQSGGVIQVVTGTYSTQTSTTSTSFVTTGLTGTITPKFATSKILVLISNTIYITRAGLDANAKLQLINNLGTLITQANGSLYVSAGTSSSELITQPFIQYLDSPATTSAVTYTLKMAVVINNTMYAQYSSNPAYITMMEIAA